MEGILASIQAVFRTWARRPGDALRTGRRGAAGAVGPMVRLLEDQARPAAAPLEQRVVAVLRRCGAIPLRALAAEVATDLYLDELRQGAWATDIGVPGEGLFVPEVVREVEAGHGGRWWIEGPASPFGAGAGGPPAGGPPCGEER